MCRAASLGREEFLKKVWEWKENSGGTIINQLKRLGRLMRLVAKPIHHGQGFHDAVLKAFVLLHDKGCIYRGKRLGELDPHFETAISDLEVEQVEVEGKLWRFRYPVGRRRIIPASN